MWGYYSDKVADKNLSVTYVRHCSKFVRYAHTECPIEAMTSEVAYISKDVGRYIEKAGCYTGSCLGTPQTHQTTQEESKLGFTA